MADRTAPTRWQASLAGGDAVSILVRTAAINLLVNDEQPSYTFDPLGRLHGAFVAGRNYRRSLDNRVLCKWAERRQGRRQRQRRWLAAAEAQDLIESAYELARRVVNRAQQAPTPVQEALARLAAWDWAALQADRRRFQQIYTPVGILPPDQYLALVLQATHGCSHNACTFCTFYRDQPFRIEPPAAFRAHVQAVLDFFGPALAMRRSLFLADANALVAPMPRLLAWLDTLAEFPQLTERADLGGTAAVPRLLPIFAFVDAFHAHRKGVADWQALQARGLHRVYIGMESGHDPLLRWLDKPGTAAAVLEAVMALKGAGLNVSLIIMLGIGGDRYAAGHVADSAALLNAMPLAGGDLVYLSDFVELPGAPYREQAAAAGVGALDSAALRRQGAALKAAFLPHDPANPPQFSRYNVLDFLY